MNLKTTLALLVLVGAGAGLFWYGIHLPEQIGQRIEQRPQPSGDSGSIKALAIEPSDLQKIEIQAGSNKTVLTRAKDGSWVLPGYWPSREPQVRELRALLAGLRSRFSPIAITKTELADYGLKKPAATVKLTLKDKTKRTLTLGEGTREGDQFDRPTYLRVDDRMEVLRLGPGLLNVLLRPADYYQQRRLFPVHREERGEGISTRIDRVAARRIELIDDGERRMVLVKHDGEWRMEYPFSDALDPTTRDRLLESLGNLWAEKFLDAKAAKEFKNPQREVIVTREDGEPVTLQIGQAVSELPLPGQTPRVLARIKRFDRVFELDGTPLASVFVGVDLLRDSQVARFTPGDVREIELSTSKGTLLLRNDTPASRPARGPIPLPKWTIVKPYKAPADAQAIDKVLTTLSTLTTKERIDPPAVRLSCVAGLFTAPVGRNALQGLPNALLMAPETLVKTYGLEKPRATVRVTVEVGKGAAKKRKTWTVRLGREDVLRQKLAVLSQQWQRINEVEPALADMIIDKSVLDFRGKQLLDYARADVQMIDVSRSDLGTRFASVASLLLPGWTQLAGVAILSGDRSETVILARSKTGWDLQSPVKTEADVAPVDALADQFARLKVLNFVSDKATPADLARYGLGLPALRVKVTFGDKNKPARTLLVGSVRRDGPGSYARFANAPEVFTLSDDLVSLLAKGSLSYRPSQLWQIDLVDQITGLKIAKAGQAEYRLDLKGKQWQVSGPFSVTAPLPVVQRLTAELMSPVAESWREHAARDLASFGLDKPAVKVFVTTKNNKTFGLWLGKETHYLAKATPGAPPASRIRKGRFACLDRSRAVFVIGEPVAKAVDQSALDFLDRGLLTFNPDDVESLSRAKGSDKLQIVKDGGSWQLKPGDVTGDEVKIPALLKQLGGLKAIRIAAYKPSDLKLFGLDKAAATVVIKLKQELKPSELTLELGKELDPVTGDRYGRIKGKESVAVIDGSVCRQLLGGALMLRDHTLGKLGDPDGFKIEAGDRKLTVGRVDGVWKLTAPIKADVKDEEIDKELFALLSPSGGLRADELVQEKPTKAELKKYKLDVPVRRWTFLDGMTTNLDLAVGGLAEDGERRYAKLAGNDLVFLLNAKLSAALMKEIRPTGVWKTNIDPAQVDSLKFTFSKDSKRESFELKKSNGLWEIVGDEDAKVNAKVVSDTLAALRGLKLERYIKDTGADLKLYGLEPVELTLQITTADGTRTLLLGGLMGTTKQRYAKRPGATKDVFVLEAAASEKLSREKKAFMGEK